MSFKTHLTIKAISTGIILSLLAAAFFTYRLLYLPRLGDDINTFYLSTLIIAFILFWPITFFLLSITELIEKWNNYNSKQKIKTILLSIFAPILFIIFAMAVAWVYNSAFLGGI